MKALWSCKSILIEAGCIFAVKQGGTAEFELYALRPCNIYVTGTRVLFCFSDKAAAAVFVTNIGGKTWIFRQLF